MPEKTVVYYEGGIFRVQHLQVPGRRLPYEFVGRIGAVTILPIITDNPSGPQVPTIYNERYHYGPLLGIPGGNRTGGFSNPEPPLATALRELREETGYTIPDQGHVTVFQLREVSHTIDYPRFFVVLRGVRYTGGEESSPREKVTVQPTPLETYMQPLFDLERSETYPEVNAAFAKAGHRLGRDTVLQWLVSPNADLSATVAENFAPWLVRLPNEENG